MKKMHTLRIEVRVYLYSREYGSLVHIAIQYAHAYGTWTGIPGSTFRTVSAWTLHGLLEQVYLWYPVSLSQFALPCRTVRLDMGNPPIVVE